MVSWSLAKNIMLKVTISPSGELTKDEKYGALDDWGTSLAEIPCTKITSLF